MSMAIDSIDDRSQEDVNRELQKFYCHWDTHQSDVLFANEKEFDLHVRNHFGQPEEPVPQSLELSPKLENAIACHWDSCHELIEVDEIFDHFRSSHSKNSTHPHEMCSGSDLCLPSNPDAIQEANNRRISQNQFDVSLMGPVHAHAHTNLKFPAATGNSEEISTSPSSSGHSPVTPAHSDTEIGYRMIAGKPTILPNLQPHATRNPIFGSLDQDGVATQGPADASEYGPWAQPSDVEAMIPCHWLDGTDECSLLFPSSHDLNQHIVQDHVGRGFQEYQCSWSGCGRDQPFRHRQKLVRHLQVHAKDLSCKCHVCGKACNDEAALRHHAQIHTGGKPFQCDICGKSFALSASLTVHKRVHTGEKPLVCKYPGCNKRFSDSSNLTKHMKTHGPKRYECPDCGHKFTRKDQLRRHRTTGHACKRKQQQQQHDNETVSSGGAASGSPMLHPVAAGAHPNVPVHPM